MIDRFDPPPGDTLNADAQQYRANEHFREASSYWDIIYTAPDLESTIYQRRMNVVMRMVDSLHLPKDARILEIGCGAGRMAVAIAKRGYRIDAIDTVEEMLARAKRHIEEANVANAVRVGYGDAYAIPFREETFDLTVAVGVLPWLHSPQYALREIRRVTKQGGSVILTSDNSHRLSYALDPRRSRLIAPFWQATKRGLRAVGMYQPRQQGASVYMYSVKEANALVASVIPDVMEGATVGFGPFTFFGRNILPESVGRWLDSALQRYADKGVPGVRSAGSHYVLLVRK